MDQVDFGVGDIVSLNSGGVDMTVTGLRKDGVLECAWIDDDGQLHRIQAQALCFFHSDT